MMHFVSLVVFMVCWQAVGAVNNEFYSIVVKDASGNPISLEKYRNKVLLIVNVASECGYTDSHYRALVKLQQRLEPTGLFQVLAFPCNQFGIFSGQEPKEINEIMHFVSTTYDVNFQLFGKVDVIGSDATKLWKYLQETSNVAPDWNFWKYLVDHEGNIKGAWGPRSSVESLTEIINETVQLAGDVVGDHSEL